MTVDPTFGLIVFLALLMASRVLQFRALKLLSSEEKARLLETASRQSIFTLLTVVVLVALFYLASRVLTVDLRALLIAYFALLMVAFAVFMRFNMRRLAKLAMPQSYIRQTYFVYALQFLGIVLLLFVSFPR
jgi:hypothetical protein